MRLFITGASGACGSVLKDLNYEKKFFDLKECPEFLYNSTNSTYIQGNISDQELIKKEIQDYDVLIHLAAADYYPDFNMDSSDDWDNYILNNITYLKNLYDSAIQAGVKNIIFASTHRVMGMYEKIHAPKIYELDHGIKIDHKQEPMPDSFYAVTKLFGENLGRFLVEERGISYTSLRIGSVREKDYDHPYAYAEYGFQQNLWSRESEKYKNQVNRLKGLWQSRRDFLQIIDLLIKFDAKEYNTFYGVSNNDRRWFDIDHASKKIGYKPKDNSETINFEI
tara:strand:- start:203 stop:1042 length:840 start_codon:yes stop_codon:yes gene_type:complete